MSELKDEADWTDVKIRSYDVCGQDTTSSGRYRWKGYRYVTEGEWLLAKLLDHLKIPFTPDVRFERGAIPNSGGEMAPCYVPDFVFDGRAYVWTDPLTGVQQVIHGIEAKGTETPASSAKARRKTDALWRKRRIRIKILYFADIEEFWRLKTLPVYPLTP